MVEWVLPYNIIHFQILLWVSYCYLRLYVNVKHIMLLHSEHNFISRFSKLIFEIWHLYKSGLFVIVPKPFRRGYKYKMLIQSRHLASLVLLSLTPQKRPEPVPLPAGGSVPALPSDMWRWPSGHPLVEVWPRNLPRRIWSRLITTLVLETSWLIGVVKVRKQEKGSISPLGLGIEMEYQPPISPVYVLLQAENNKYSYLHITFFSNNLWEYTLRKCYAL